jgi:hypothetical protein
MVLTRKSLSALGALFCYVNQLASTSQLTSTAQRKLQLKSSWKTKYKVARVVSANIVLGSYSIIVNLTMFLKYLLLYLDGSLIKSLEIFNFKTPPQQSHSYY